MFGVQRQGYKPCRLRSGVVLFDRGLGSAAQTAAQPDEVPVDKALGSKIDMKTRLDLFGRHHGTTHHTAGPPEYNHVPPVSLVGCVLGLPRQF